MEQKDIDIYEILKDEEYGTELYTPKCGKVWHSGMANDKDSAKAIWTEDEAGREHFFDKNGKIYKEGEILLFPSNEMRDWSKFSRRETCSFIETETYMLSLKGLKIIATQDLIASIIFGKNVSKIIAKKNPK